MKTVELAGRSWQWSSEDVTCFNYLTKHFGDVRFMMEAVPKDRRGICVQAGGNFGVWPVLLSAYFEHVITFEPDQECFACLQANTRTCMQIEAYPFGLSDKTQNAEIVIPQKRNRGAQYLRYGDGPVSCITLDSMELSGLDLLDLDIEGAEALALEGARATIAKYKPIVVVEDWQKNGHPGHHVRNNISPISGAQWLEANGYKLIGAVSQDKIYAPQ